MVPWERQEEEITKRDEETLGLMDIFVDVIEAMASWVYIHVKHIKSYSFNSCSLLICQLLINRATLKNGNPCHQAQLAYCHYQTHEDIQSPSKGTRLSDSGNEGTASVWESWLQPITWA